MNLSLSTLRSRWRMVAAIVATAALVAGMAIYSVTSTDDADTSQPLVDCNAIKTEIKQDMLLVEVEAYLYTHAAVAYNIGFTQWYAKYTNRHLGAALQLDNRLNSEAQSCFSIDPTTYSSLKALTSEQLFGYRMLSVNKMYEQAAWLTHSSGLTTQVLGGKCYERTSKLRDTFTALADEVNWRQDTSAHSDASEAAYRQNIQQIRRTLSLKRLGCMPVRSAVTSARLQFVLDTPFAQANPYWFDFMQRLVLIDGGVLKPASSE